MQCFYDDGYFLPLPAGHPFPMDKFADARALLGDTVSVHPPPLLSFADITRVHDPAYLRAVSFDASAESPQGLTRYARNRLGLPAHPRLLERSMLETAGTVAATRAALADGRAANLAGGTHHAFPDRGLGYCVLNDVAVAVEFLRAAGKCPHQILIADTDAHQGNGNHAYFRNDSAVFTYSIHVGRNYPAEKVPGDRDVPLERNVSGAAYLRALDESLPPVFARLEPDLVFWISGADNHVDDRFGQMSLTADDMARRDRFIVQLCETYAAPFVALYGGGYNRHPGQTAALHAQTIRIAAGSGAEGPVLW